MSRIDEDKDQGWMGHYIRVRTSDLIPEEKLLFPEEWNFDRKPLASFKLTLASVRSSCRKSRGERDALRLLYGQKDEETIDRLAAEKETILAKLLSADVQLRNVKQKGSVQAKRIGELEARLAEAEAEVESSKVMADNSIAVYRADAEAAQTEIHARGFDLDEEIKKAKELEVDAESLVSVSDDDVDDDDDDDDSKGGSDDEGEPGGEETALDNNLEA
nr:ribosomal L1 domain-containing protein CG13096-like [Nicotiana tomentosiformis]